MMYTNSSQANRQYANNVRHKNKTIRERRKKKKLNVKLTIVMRERLTTVFTTVEYIYWRYKFFRKL